MKNKGPMGEPGDEVPVAITENLFQINKELISTLNVTVLKKVVSLIELEMNANKDKLAVCYFNRNSTKFAKFLHFFGLFNISQSIYSSSLFSRRQRGREMECSQNWVTSYTQM